MMLKIMCTYAHDVILGSRSKMASSHRVTDLEFVLAWISKDEAPTPLSVVGPFISSLLFHLSWALLGAWRFSLFRSVYSSFHSRLDLHQGAYLLWGVLFYFPNVSLFVSSYVKMKTFCSFYFNRLAISWHPCIRVWGWLVTSSCHSLFCLMACPFVSQVISFIYDVRVREVVSMFNKTSHCVG